MARLSTAKDIVDLLLDVDSISTTIVASNEPESPDTVVTIYNTSSSDAPNPKYLIDKPSIQIRSRSKSYATAYSNLQEIFDALLGRGSFTSNTTVYTGIWANTGIFDMGQDDNSRHILAVNMRLTAEPVYDSQHRSAI